jgi:hypothetical protein
MFKLTVSFAIIGLLVNILSSTPLKQDYEAINSTPVKSVPEFTDCDTYLADLLKADRRKRSSSSEIERERLEYELACINYILDILNENEETTNVQQTRDENMAREARRIKGGSKQMKFWKRARDLKAKSYKNQKFW